MTYTNTMLYSQCRDCCTEGMRDGTDAEGRNGVEAPGESRTNWQNTSQP